MGLFPKERDLTRPPERVELFVDASAMGARAVEVEVRLDAFLAQHLKWRSRTSIQRLIKGGWLLVDASTPDHPHGTGELQRETRPGRRLKHGSRVVVVIPPDLRLPAFDETAGALSILYEDAACVAVEKPAGLPVHPSGRHARDTLIQRVHAHYRALIEERREAPRLCHRLDRETSGIVLVAKEPRAHRALARQFEERAVEKEYLAIVWGLPAESEGTIELALGPARASSVGLKVAVAADGSPSRTGWRVVERRADCALLACRPFTGRQHQIRVHLAAIGHPLVGDKLYGADEDLFRRGVAGELSPRDLRDLGMARHALHDHRLAFVSPATGTRVEVVSPLPEDMRAFLERESVEESSG